MLAKLTGNDSPGFFQPYLEMPEIQLGTSSIQSKSSANEGVLDGSSRLGIYEIMFSELFAALRECVSPPRSRNRNSKDFQEDALLW